MRQCLGRRDDRGNGSRNVRRKACVLLSRSRQYVRLCGRAELLRNTSDRPHNARVSRYRPLSERSAAELHAQAKAYRSMAEDARTVPARVGLEALARRFAALAAQRERQEKQLSDASVVNLPKRDAG